MDEKRNEQAMKLYEAMSGVDPELLARSEGAEKKNKVIPFWRYAKVMAACLALFVVGSACWAVMQNGLTKTANMEGASESKKSDSAAITQANEAPAANGDGEQMNAICADESTNYEAQCDAMEEAVTANNEAAGNTVEAQFEDGSESEWPEGVSTSEYKNCYKGIQSLDVNGLKKEELIVAGKTLGVNFATRQSGELTNAAIIYKTIQYLEQLKKEEAESCELDDDHLTITVYADAAEGTTSGDEQKVEVYSLDRKYMKLSVKGKFYEIVDPEYDYELLADELMELLQEED